MTSDENAWETCGNCEFELEGVIAARERSDAAEILAGDPIDCPECGHNVKRDMVSAIVWRGCERAEYEAHAGRVGED